MNLILLRHGESIWNKSNIFTGWKNIPLTCKGIYEAKNVGNYFKLKKIKIDYIFTSQLKRAILTANIVNTISGCNKKIIKSWRLNERSYGKLEGISREYVKKNYMDEYLKFKNCIFTKPYISYFSYPEDKKAESIYQVNNRFKPLWYKQIKPILKDNKTVLIVSHKNQIKSILYFLNLNHDIEIKNCYPIFLKII